MTLNGHLAVEPENSRPFTWAISHKGPFMATKPSGTRGILSCCFSARDGKGVGDNNIALRISLHCEETFQWQVPILTPLLNSVYFTPIQYLSITGPKYNSVFSRATFEHTTYIQYHTAHSSNQHALPCFVKAPTDSDHPVIVLNIYTNEDHF